MNSRRGAAVATIVLLAVGVFVLVLTGTRASRG